MDRPNLPLNALRVFEVAVRQGSFTGAAIELCVTQAAVSHQILRLEDQLGVKLFHRTPKGLILTSEAEALSPVLTSSFDQIGGVLDRFLDGRYVETINVGVVTTFAAGWLIRHLAKFEKLHPGISIRLFTNNNRVDIAREGLDFAIRFGQGTWPGLIAQPLMKTPLTPLCAPSLAVQMKTPADLAEQVLLRSYRSDEWPTWFKEVATLPPKLDGPVFDSSIAMAELAASGMGVALLPVPMFAEQLADGRLARPFPMEITTGRYWITRLSNKAETSATRAFEAWLTEAVN